MAEKRPTSKDFGKRRPQPLPLPPKQPVKRSGHVALLVMGTIAVGTTAYTLMPRQSCDTSAPGTAAAQPNTACSGHGWSGGGGGTTHHYSFFSSDSSSRSSSGTSSDAGASSVTRGGFGAFAHAFGFSGRG